MNLEDVIDPEYGLQQDDYSLSRPRFGDEGQLEVVGWSGRCHSTKYYIVKCHACSEDFELFGEGYFKSLKNSLREMSLPCGCGRPVWSEEQYRILCKRKATELGYAFIDFIGNSIKAKTKIKMWCMQHGTWETSTISGLLNLGNGCPKCANEGRSENNRKPDEDMITSFFASGAFHPDTKFWRSDRLSSQGFKCFWKVYCPECSFTGESACNDLQKGHRPCGCCQMRQQEAYINIIMDCDNTVAIKFGITRDSSLRTKQQSSKCFYIVKQDSVYTFPSVESCKAAERECKQTLDCGVVLKRDMPDGYTETTWAYNLDKIKQIYEKHGGVPV